jgi:hypothetical protein
MNLHLKTNRRNSAFLPQATPNNETELATVQEILLAQSEQINYQQEQLNDLGKGFKDIAGILQKQQDSNSKEAIEEINESIVALSEAILSLHQQLKQANFGQGFTDIKAQHQLISQAVTNNHKSLVNQTSDLAYYLGWKRITTIVVSTVLISSLSSAMFGLLVPLITNQITKKSQATNIEKVEHVVKKRKVN